MLGLLGLAVLVSSHAFSQETLVNIGDTWKYFKGTVEPPVEWPTVTFDDNDWLEGPTGIGYGDSDDATVLTDMRQAGAVPGYLSLYARRTFEVADVSQTKLLRFEIDFDDGFVAYLNGAEIARQGLAGTPPTFDETADSHDAGTAVSFDVSATALLQGTNVLAVQVNNTNLTSSDLSMIPKLVSYADVCPTSLTCTVRANGDIYLRWVNPVSPPPFSLLEIHRNGAYLADVPNLNVPTYTDNDPLSGQNLYEVRAFLDDNSACTDDGIPSCQVPENPTENTFRRGDADDSESVNLTDAVYILNGLFLGQEQPSCPDAADADDDGNIRLTDAIYILLHLFQGGPVPPSPGSTKCGEDPEDDRLADCEYTSC